MGEKPILFSGPMVRAILEGRKTQTRRTVRLPVSRGVLSKDGWRRWDPERAEDRESMAFGSWVYGRPGDRLWVRETWRGWNAAGAYLGASGWVEIDYKADKTRRRLQADETQIRQARVVGGVDVGETRDPWRPSLHMPRWASRLTLEVVSVRVERLQAISEEDARAEGVQAAPFCKRGRPTGMEHVEAFEDLWDSINGQRASWASDPWVWAVEFKRVEAV